MKKDVSVLTPLRCIVLVLLVSFAVYFNSLFNDFVYDDHYQVLENSWIKDIGSLPEIFSTSVVGFLGSGVSNTYRPAMHLIYMFDYHIFGLHPWGYHLVNILVHGAVSVLVFLIISGLL